MAGYIFPNCACLAAIVAQLTVASDTNHEQEKVARLLETNTKLCDQVEIFEAVTANDTVDAAGNDRKSTAIGRLRRQLEEENKMFQSKFRDKAQGSSILSTSEESESQTGSIQSEMPSTKRQLNPTPSSAEARPIFRAPAIEDKPLAPAHTASKAIFWNCCSCGNKNNKKLSPLECGTCAHIKCTSCGREYSM